jgi:hypothetical protein
MPFSKSSDRFNELILEAVDDGLSLLGDEPVKRVFYYQVERRANIRREDIPQKLIAFHEALKDMFFEGALILERRMARHIYETLNLAFEANNGWTISEYVQKAKLLLG